MSNAPLAPDLTHAELSAHMNPLERHIRYKFRNSLLLAEALTHPSLSFERKTFHFDNQRLEFLGDAVLQLVITHHLYRLFPTFSEGQLTKLRSRLVSREGLKKHATALGLGRYLMLGRGEESSGGRDRASTLADAFEALIGAGYVVGPLAGLAGARSPSMLVTMTVAAAVVGLVPAVRAWNAWRGRQLVP